jgi:hypothetical protein
MNEISGTIKNGQVVLNEPLSWPDGTKVRVEQVASPAGNGTAERTGVAVAEVDAEESQPDDAEAIARWIAEFEAIPPLEMTADEEADWRSAREAQRQMEIAAFPVRADELRKIAE